MRGRLIAGATGALAAGAGLGIAAERLAVGRVRLRPDPEAREPFFGLPADRTRQVAADDGVLLHVEEVGPADAPLTLVFTHGYLMEMAAWHYQRRDLADLGRLVFWDLRSHGRSARAPAGSCSIEQLGRDLGSVVEAVAPTGRVVLVGHSLGGMTVMALAGRHPEWFGDRVVGVALLSTSAGRIAELTFGLPARFSGTIGRVVPLLARGISARSRLLEHGRRVGSDLAYVLTRRLSFASREVSPALVGFMEQMVAAVPLDVMADFFDAFVSHNQLAALPVLDGVPTLVLVGGADVQTPPSHSRDIAAAVPSARLEVVEDAAHMVPLERPALVNLHLRALVARVRVAHRRASA